MRSFSPGASCTETMSRRSCSNTVDASVPASWSVVVEGIDLSTLSKPIWICNAVIDFLEEGAGISILGVASGPHRHPAPQPGNKIDFNWSRQKNSILFGKIDL